MCENQTLLLEQLPQVEKSAERWERASFRFRLFSWLRAIQAGDGGVKILDNMSGLFDLGHAIGPLSTILENPVLFSAACTPYGLGFIAGLTRSMAENVAQDQIIPLGQAKQSAIQLRNLIDEIWKDRAEPSALMRPFTHTETERLKATITEFIFHLRHELNELPIFLATKRAAYDVRVLIMAAEQVLNANHLPLLSDKTLFDIREAGICIAFNVPTAAGFHSVRAVEAVARGYHEVITGVRPGAETPLGPLINGLRNERDARLLAKTIDKEDLLNLAIDFLARINNIYRKPITHPEMILDLPTGMTVFDTMKCAITLILDDSPTKRAVPIPPKFF